MNLKENPTVNKLAMMISQCDDANKYYFIAVDHHAEVFVVEHPFNYSPGYKKYLFYFDLFPARRGYVGLAASMNAEWMQELFDEINYCWIQGKTGLIDHCFLLEVSEA